jgi:hypothetical protein
MTRKFYAWLNDFSDHDHGNYCARRVEQEAIYINALINAQRTAVKEASINFNRHANIFIGEFLLGTADPRTMIIIETHTHQGYSELTCQ